MSESETKPSAMSVTVRHDGYVSIGGEYDGSIVEMSCGEKSIERLVGGDNRIYFSRAYSGRLVRVEVVGHVDSPPECDCGRSKTYVSNRRIHGWFCNAVGCNRI